MNIKLLGNKGWQRLETQRSDKYQFPEGINPTEISAEEVNAFKYLAEGNLHKASLEFEHVLRRQPSHTESWAKKFFELGHTWLAMNTFVNLSKSIDSAQYNNKDRELKGSNEGWKGYLNTISIFHFNSIYENIDINELHFDWQPYTGRPRFTELCARHGILTHALTNIDMNPELSTFLLATRWLRSKRCWSQNEAP